MSQILTIEKQADPKPFLTPRDAAKLLNVPTEKILDMIENKKLRAFKVGRLWRLRASDLSKHLQEKSG